MFTRTARISATGAVAIFVLALIADALACPSKHTPPPTTTPRPTPSPTASPTPMPPATANIFFMSIHPDDPGMTSWFNASEECQSVGLSLPSSISTRREERITEFLSSLPVDYPDTMQLWRGRTPGEPETTCRSVATTRSTSETSFNQLHNCSESLHGFLCGGTINLSSAPNMSLIGCTGACALFFE